jgi:hypothetical protein
MAVWEEEERNKDMVGSDVKYVLVQHSMDHLPNK